MHGAQRFHCVLLREPERLVRRRERVNEALGERGRVVAVASWTEGLQPKQVAGQMPV